MRVQQTMTFLLSVLNEVRDGALAPAPMQRDYVWSRQDVTDFCDSVQDGLPIGAITTWRPGDGAEVSPKTGRVGPISAQTAPALILDGHNRLATCAWVITPRPELLDGVGDAEAAVWCGDEVLALDPEIGRARFFSTDEVRTRMLMTTDQACDNRRMREWSTAALRGGMSEAAWDAAVALAGDFETALREQKLVLTQISEATPEEAKSVFLRVCRAGVPMSGEDFDRAMRWDADGLRM